MRLHRSLIIKSIGTLLLLFFGMVVAGLIVSSKISAATEKFVIEQAEQSPEHRVGLLLGTSKVLNDGRKNLYFDYRIQATADLFHAKKIHYVLVSGDNSRQEYNEPMDMKQALIAAGVPDSAIILDFAGFRTFDSVLRCREVFGQSSFIVISQRFHVERAVFIARKKGMDVFGYCARDVDAYNGFKTRFREIFARLQALFDIYLLHRSPKFLGERIPIGKP